MKLIKTWHKSFLKSIQLQLFISFISLPFLIGWGLPISLLTPISTLLFGPFLTCFLFISSFIFFFELVSFPNSFLIWMLEKITEFWLLCLSYEQQSWLISFIKPPFIILLIVPIIALCIVHAKKITTIHMRIIILGISLMGTCLLLKIFPYKIKGIEKIACHKGELTLITHNNSLFLIDCGALSSRSSYESYISYSLIPEIIQKKGVMLIDYCIINRINKRILDALYFLAQKITIKNIYFPAWEGKIPRFAWHSYIELKEVIKKNNGKLIPISSKKNIYTDNGSYVSLEPEKDTSISYYDATYKKLNVEGIIDNQSFTF